jgi:DNA-binding NtrC family response regulator
MGIVNPTDTRDAVLESPVPRLLLVEPEPVTRAVLQRATRAVARVISYSEFSGAQRCLKKRSSLDFLITNVRLGIYNGLHLVYLAAAHGIRARSIAYTEQRDAGLGKEAQRAGAFYETSTCLAVTLTAYLRGTLPPHDRREPSIQDRRTIFRGGRRCWDHHIAAPDLT